MQINKCRFFISAQSLCCHNIKRQYLHKLYSRWNDNEIGYYNKKTQTEGARNLTPLLRHLKPSADIWPLKLGYLVVVTVTYKA